MDMFPLKSVGDQGGDGGGSFQRVVLVFRQAAADTHFIPYQ